MNIHAEGHCDSRVADVKYLTHLLSSSETVDFGIMEYQLLRKKRTVGHLSYKRTRHRKLKRRKVIVRDVKAVLPLENQRWYRKHMVMNLSNNIWIPFKNHEFAPKHCLKIMKKSAIFRDMSHLSICEIAGDFFDISPIFQSSMNPVQYNKCWTHFCSPTDNNRWSYSHEFEDIEIYVPDRFPEECLGVVRLAIIPRQSTTSDTSLVPLHDKVWISCEPCLFEAIKNWVSTCFSSFQISFPDINRFHLTGKAVSKFWSDFFKEMALLESFQSSLFSLSDCASTSKSMSMMSRSFSNPNCLNSWRDGSIAAVECPALIWGQNSSRWKGVKKYVADYLKDQPAKDFEFHSVSSGLNRRERRRQQAQMLLNDKQVWNDDLIGLLSCWPVKNLSISRLWNFGAIERTRNKSPIVEIARKVSKRSIKGRKSHATSLHFLRQPDSEQEYQINELLHQFRKHFFQLNKLKNGNENSKSSEVDNRQFSLINAMKVWLETSQSSSLGLTTPMVLIRKLLSPMKHSKNNKKNNSSHSNCNTSSNSNSNSHSNSCDSHNSWDVILPRGIGGSFVKILVSYGFRSIGTIEQHFLDRKLGIMTFPRDYVDTTQGVQYWIQQRDLWSHKPRSIETNRVGYRAVHMILDYLGALSPEKLTYSLSDDNQRSSMSIIPSNNSKSMMSMMMTKKKVKMMIPRQWEFVKDMDWRHWSPICPNDDHEMPFWSEWYDVHSRKWMIPSLLEADAGNAETNPSTESDMEEIDTPENSISCKESCAKDSDKIEIYLTALVSPIGKGTIDTGATLYWLPSESATVAYSGYFLNNVRDIESGKDKTLMLRSVTACSCHDSHISIEDSAVLGMKLHRLDVNLEHHEMGIITSGRDRELIWESNSHSSGVKMSSKEETNCDIEMGCKNEDCHPSPSYCHGHDTRNTKNINIRNTYHVCKRGLRSLPRRYPGLGIVAAKHYEHWSRLILQDCLNAYFPEGLSDKSLLFLTEFDTIWKTRWSKGPYPVIYYRNPESCWLRPAQIEILPKSND